MPVVVYQHDPGGRIDIVYVAAFACLEPSPSRAFPPHSLFAIITGNSLRVFFQHP